MKFKILISKYATWDENDARQFPPRDICELDGELDAVKTYLKLRVVTDTFEWGAVERIDTNKLENGDVDRWMISKNHTTGELSLNVFSFYGVEPDININTAMNAFHPDPGMAAVNALLGGGKF